MNGAKMFSLLSNNRNNYITRVRGTVRSLQDLAKVRPLYDLCPDARHNLELVEADLTEEKSWIEAVKGCTYVHHVASPFPSVSPTDEDDVIGPAVAGTLRVLRAAAKDGGVRRVMLTSSCVAVGLCGGNTHPFTENDWTDLSNKYITAYAKSKHLAERAAWDYVKELPHDEKFELAVVNPAFVLGPPATKSSGTSISVRSNELPSHLVNKSGA
ncbi:dihydroflavonol 4-reductase [Elysia marginata]|uniref:Dihydroflavonol 4-reductase n=1 Tax=Elysia marginata TaxID=1093978 RepID=A0AAV4IWH9_9GAST|nr:dihydroflavonol 4-reductase [Elysia marginata]